VKKEPSREVERKRPSGAPGGEEGDGMLKRKTYERKEETSKGGSLLEGGVVKDRVLPKEEEEDWSTTTQ